VKVINHAVPNVIASDTTPTIFQSDYFPVGAYVLRALYNSRWRYAALN